MEFEKAFAQRCIKIFFINKSDDISDNCVTVLTSATIFNCPGKEQDACKDGGNARTGAPRSGCGRKSGHDLDTNTAFGGTCGV